MHHQAFIEYRQQCSKYEIAFFDLLKSIVDIRECEAELSADDIEQLVAGVRVLNGLIARNTRHKLVV